MYDTDYEKKAVSVKFIPATYTNNGKLEAPFGVFENVNFEVSARYIRNKNKEHDFAVLLFDKPIGDQTGFFELSTLPENIQLDQFVITITDCPGDVVPWQGTTPQMYTMNGHIKKVDVQMLLHTIDTYKGSSGSGVLYMKNGVPTIVGVHTHGFIGNLTDLNRYNSAQLLNSEKMQIIKGLVAIQTLKINATADKNNVDPLIVAQQIANLQIQQPPQQPAVQVQTPIAVQPIIVLDLSHRMIGPWGVSQHITNYSCDHLRLLNLTIILEMVEYSIFWRLNIRHFKILICLPTISEKQVHRLSLIKDGIYKHLKN